jgi:hypothetical protein
MNPKFDYEGAKKEGYSDEEIKDFLSKNSKTKKFEYKKPEKDDSAFTTIGKNFSNFFGSLKYLVSGDGNENESPINEKLFKKVKNFDIQGALQEGYSPEEINEFLQENQPETSFLEKTGRLAGQLGLGAAEMKALPYEIGVAPLGISGGQEALGDLFTRETLSDVYPTEEEGAAPRETMFSPPERELKEPINLGIRSLAEKATGLDLHPEGVLEKAAGWLGFIKNPSNWKEVAKIGLKPKELIKALSPSGTEITRGLTAGTALEMAEDGNLGPIGTLGAAIVGDLSGFGPKALLNVAKNPKKSLAQVTNFLTGANNQKEWIKQIVSDANEAGIQLDAGTLTNSNLIRMAQARAAQSSLSGKSLDNFKKDLSQQIVNGYSRIVDELGTLSFENNHQAAESIRNFVNKGESKFSLQRQKIPGEVGEGRSLEGRISVQEQPNPQQEFLNRIAPREFENSYQAGEDLKTVAEDIKTPIKQEFNQRWENLNREIETLTAGPQSELARSLDVFVNDHAGSLLLGESSAENRVFQAARRLRSSLMTESGDLIGVTIRDLIKTKRTLGDIANWEFGGSNFQSAYKNLVSEIDRSVERTLGEFNPELRNAYEHLNAEYSAFKDMFENKNVMPLFEPKNQNYNSIYNSFIKNPDKLRSLEDIMFNNPRGGDLINQIKRDYAQGIVENPNLTARELRDLEAVLGPTYRDAIQDFVIARQHALEHPLPRPSNQQSLGIRPQSPETIPSKPIRKGVEKSEHAERKLHEYIKGKSSDQILKMMDTVEGIRKLKRSLSLTPDGQKLFEELARFKLSEMIDRKMMDSLKENVKMGTFSGLLKSSGDQAIVKELLGPEKFKQFQLLQKNAGILQSSVDKFYNASKSGTTLADTALASTAVIGVFTGNPYLTAKAVASIGGMQLIGHLLSDKQFLKYLEEAATSKSKIKFTDALNKMKPSVNRAILYSTTKQND